MGVELLRTVGVDAWLHLAVSHVILERSSNRHAISAITRGEKSNRGAIPEINRQGIVIVS